jgi:hypothetical protein
MEDAVSEAHKDSDSGLQWHVRYRVAGQPGAPRWSHIVSDEQDARGLLATCQRDPTLTDVALFIRDVSPWKEAEL